MQTKVYCEVGTKQEVKCAFNVTVTSGLTNSKPTQRCQYSVMLKQLCRMWSQLQD